MRGHSRALVGWDVGKLLLSLGVCIPAGDACGDKKAGGTSESGCQLCRCGSDFDEVCGRKVHVGTDSEWLKEGIDDKTGSEKREAVDLVDTSEWVVTDT